MQQHSQRTMLRIRTGLFCLSLIGLLSVSCLSPAFAARIINCNGVTAKVQADPKNIDQFYVVMNGTFVKLERGLEYDLEPKCVTFRNEKKVAVIGFAGQNETFTLVDLDTFKLQDISYQQAKKIGVLAAP